MGHHIHMQPDVPSALRECIRFVADGGWMRSTEVGDGDRRSLLDLLNTATVTTSDYVTSVQAVALGIQNYWSAPRNFVGAELVKRWSDAPGRTPEQVAGVLAWALEYVTRHTS